MAVFSRSLFQSVLDRLDEDQPEPVDSAPESIAVRGLKASFAVDTGPAAAAGAGHAGAFEAFGADPVADLPPAWLDRLDPEEIAADLGLDPADGAEEIQAKRRAFARLNHPDRVAAIHAIAATLRMMTANRLCDDALARLAQGKPG